MSAAALGMAYFFVLKSQTSFDVRWCRANVGEKIFRPWVTRMEERGVTTLPNTRVVDLVLDSERSRVCGIALADGSEIAADVVVLGVGVNALRNIVRSSPQLASVSEEFARMADLRWVGALGTHITSPA
jgi:tRNA U34 5-carboxymethylaminomethyl modifying enzyme MnmG/GidA